MKSMLFFLLLTSISFFSNAGKIDVKGIHPICEDLKYLSTDPNIYISHYFGIGGTNRAYGKEYTDVARESFLYAQMASNVYESYDSDKPEFPLKQFGYEKQGKKHETWRGLGAQVYENGNEIVIAFEGTNATSLRDWLFGNLNLIFEGQYAEAKDFMREIVKENGSNKRYIVTGHSLGGALAISVALSIPNVKAYAFNSSLKVIPDEDADNSGSEITLISENKDILRKLNEQFNIFEFVPNKLPYSQFDFLEEPGLTDEGWDSVKKSLIEHSIYFIARGLTVYAAASNFDPAKNSLRYIVDSTLDKMNQGEEGKLNSLICTQ